MNDEMTEMGSVRPVMTVERHEFRKQKTMTIVRNPPSSSVLRTSLRPGLLKAVALNESHRRPGVALYEIGHVYPPGGGQLPDEYEALGVVLAGAEAPAAMSVWRELTSAMGWGARVDQSRPPAGLHPTRSATLSLGRDRLGAVGEVHPDALEAFGIAERVAVLELNLSVVLANEPKPAQWKPTSRYPSSDIDLAFLTPGDVPAEKVDKAIRQGAGPLLVDLALFDVYRGQGGGGIGTRAVPRSGVRTGASHRTRLLTLAYQVPLLSGGTERSSCQGMLGAAPVSSSLRMRTDSIPAGTSVGSML